METATTPRAELMMRPYGDAHYSEHEDNGQLLRSRDYFGRKSGVATGSEGFMLEFPPHGVGTAHFHEVDQFQIFLGSSGATYQRSAVPTFLLHYTDAYSMYGPFGAGDEPLRLITLRAVENRFIGRLPRDRDRYIRRGRRNLHVDLQRWLDTPVAAGDTAVHEVLHDDADGLDAYVLRAGAGAEVTLESTSHPGGTYVCVLTGEVGPDAEGRTLQPFAIGWAGGAYEATPLGRAGDEGASVLVMRFPHPSTVADLSRTA